MSNANLYRPEFMDHVNHPDYNYVIENASLTQDGINPSCGDELRFQVRLSEDGYIQEAAFTGQGCAISQASADMMSDLVTGKSIKEAQELCKLFTAMVRGELSDEADFERLGEAALLKDISHMPARVKCAELAWHTLEEMLKNQGN